MRSYNQFCPAARALDLIGDRWTLLIIRELLFGPKRYTDLQDGLPGVGPTLLAVRLRSLEAAGLIERRQLLPPAASAVYELTEVGGELRPVMNELFRWGIRLLGQPGPDDTVRASWLIAAIEASAQPDLMPPGIDETYEFRVGDEVVSVRVSEHGIAARQGPAQSPALLVQTDHETFAALGTHRITPEEAIRRGKLVVEGDPAAGARCSTLFGLLDSGVVDVVA